MIKTKKQMYTVIGAFVLVMLLGTVTYAFFNYTRTGVSNTIKTGRIYFNAEQGDTVTLSDLFPISLEASQEVSSETPGVGSLTLHVTGDTMYDKGIEYLVKAVDVTNTSGNASLPISIAIKYEANGQGKTIGEEDEDYYTNRGGNSSVYKVLSTNSITNDGDLVVGYIAKGQTGIDGNITIMAYLDARNIAISDTYNETSPETDSNGTTSEWVGDRTVLTTSEWNALQSSGVSFKIKIEANEGTWVEAPVPPIPTISTCPGCKFMHAKIEYQYGGSNNSNATQVSNINGVTSDYRTLNKKYFIGFTETLDGKIDRAFACGIKSEDPKNGTAFCIEGSTDSSTYISNQNTLVDLYGMSGGTNNYGCSYYGDNYTCGGDVETSAFDDGLVSVSYLGDGCTVDIDNTLYCD